MKKNILIILPIVLVLSSAFFLWKTKNQIDSDIKYVNGLLYHLDLELDLLEHSKKHYIDDKYLEDKIMHLIANEMIVLSNINPPIDRLGGTPLNALNRLVALNKSNQLDFKIGDSEYISQIINNYLSRVENKVSIEIKKRDEILSDPLKKEIKEKWGIPKQTE